MDTCEVLGGRVVAADEAVLGVVAVLAAEGVLRDRAGAVVDGGVSDATVAADRAGAVGVVVASDAAAALSAAQSQAVAAWRVSDRASSRDCAIVGLHQSLVEAFYGSDGATTLPTVKIVSDGLYASDRGIYSVDLSLQVLDAAVGRGKAVLGSDGGAGSEGVLSDAVVVGRVVSAVVVETVGANAGVLTEVGALTETVAATGLLSDRVVANLSTSLIAANAFAARDAVMFRNPNTQAWCVNTVTSALSAWKGADLQSLAQSEKWTLAAGVDGVYAVDGVNDDGSAVDSEISWGFNDFKSSAVKRIDNMYVGYNSKGLLKLRLSVQDSMYSPQEYMLEERPAAAPRTTRVTPGKGQWGRYWKASITAVKGSEFKVDSMEVDLAVSNRRI